MSIAKVISWKFNDQEGMSCQEINGQLEIVNFPGGIPSQEDQDLWTIEYQQYINSRQEADKIKVDRAEVMTQEVIEDIVLGRKTQVEIDALKVEVEAIVSRSPGQKDA